MMEFPPQPLMQSYPAKALTALEIIRIKAEKQVRDIPSFFQSQMTPEHPGASILELYHAR
jgi:hypothetical protein